MKYHAVCKLFPEMTEEEFSKLKLSIQDSGVRERVIVHNGEIVDGRHRWRACTELGIDCPTEEWSGIGSLVDFVIDKNFNRRSLTTSQRAAVMVDAAPLYEAEAKERQKAAGGAKNALVANLPQALKGKSREVAARAAGVSPRLIQDAKHVKETSPELHEKVKAGELTVNAAKKEAMKPAPPPPPVSKRPGEEALSIETKRLFTSLIDAAREIQDGVERLSKMPFGRELSLQRIQTELENAIVAIRFAMPHKLCKCGGEDKKCRPCRGMGWVTKEQAERQKKS